MRMPMLALLAALVVLLPARAQGAVFSETLCENSGTLTLGCPDDLLIQVRSAFYGRETNSQTTCPHEYADVTTQCQTDDAMEIVRTKCEDRVECDVTATTSMFGGDPCPGFHKYLRMEYTCEDVDECSSDPCANGATCTDMVSSYECICVSGYTGTHCETELCTHRDVDCALCTEEDASVCKDCNAGRFVSQETGLCEECTLEHCTECDDDGCILCDLGFSINEETKTCQDVLTPYCDEGFVVSRNASTIGGEGFIEIIDLDKCKDKCLITDQCQGLDWSHGKQPWKNTRCWLHFSLDGTTKDTLKADAYIRC